MMAYGAGAMYNFGHWAIRAEYEAYDVDKLDDLYAVTGSLQYTFFREKEKPAPVVASTPAPAPKPAASLRRLLPNVPMAITMVCAMRLTNARTRRLARALDPAGCDCDYTLALDFRVQLG